MGSLLQIGKSGMSAARTGVSTSGHNISNANTEGYTRQRVVQTNEAPAGRISSASQVGRGTNVARIERINNDYIDRQLRSTGRDLSYGEEREVILKQTEDIFNEMNGEGLNRIMSKFFNDFRRLSSEPENLALREAVRESANAMANDFRRVRGQVAEVNSHLNNKIDGYVREANQLCREIGDLNVKIRQVELSGGSPNDLMDKRDVALKNLGAIVDVTTYKDQEGGLVVDLRGIGPIVVSGKSTVLSTGRTVADESGKKSGDLEIFSGDSQGSPISGRIKAGKLGALLQTRDSTLSTLTSKMDTIAFELARSVNEIHRMGFTRNDATQVDFFKTMNQVEGAADALTLSDSVRASANNIAAAGAPGSPGDNRVALALSGIQGLRILEGGTATMDDFYNGIVSEVGVAANQNSASLNQNRDIMTQLNKMREQISGVSIDEETTQLMQYQHAFDASARVIRVADEMMKTVLSLKN
ncbi:MAG: flagellar hook-associated protein FlgK [Bdellovibrionales bacterium]|nr:flagellar hook-associated protein FlgK [Bdellovibrionales bacterium]